MITAHGGMPATINQVMKSWCGNSKFACERVAQCQRCVQCLCFGVPTNGKCYGKVRIWLVASILFLAPFLRSQEIADAQPWQTSSFFKEEGCILSDVRSISKYGVFATPIDQQAMPYLDWFNVWLRPMVSIRSTGSLQEVGKQRPIVKAKENSSLFQNDIYSIPNFSGGATWLGGNFFQSDQLIGQLWMGSNLGNNNAFTNFQLQTQNRNTILGFEQVQLFEENLGTIRIERNPDGCQQFTFDMQVFQEGPMQYIIKSGWLMPNDQSSFLFAIRLTATTKEYLKQILAEVLREADFWLANAEWKDSGVPAVYLSKRNFQHGLLILDISGKRGLEKILFDGHRQITETEPKEKLQFSWPSKPRFVLPTRDVFGLHGVIKLDQTIVDRFSVVDGSWSILYDPLHFKPQQSSITPSHLNVDFIEYGEPVNRSVHLNGKLNGNVSIWRHLNSHNKLKALDENYNALTFKAKGISHLEVSIIGENHRQWQDRDRIHIPLKRRKMQQVILPLDWFVSQQTRVQPQSIVFTVFQQKKILPKANIQVSDVTWLHLPDSTIQNLKEFHQGEQHEILWSTQTLRRLPNNY